MGMGNSPAAGVAGKGGNQNQNNQVYYDSSKSQYYTMGQPQQQSNGPFSVFGSAVQGMGGKGKGGDGRNYLGANLNQNNGTTNSLANYTAPQFQQQQNPYMNYFAQQQQQRNPYAQTQFGQMPGQYQPQYQQQMPPWAQQQQQQSYYQGPFQQYGMGGKGGMQQQNPYSQQSYYQGPFQQYGMGGKGKGNS